MRLPLCSLPLGTAASFVHALLILLCMTALTACERRALTYDYEEGTPFRVELDWSELSGAEQPQYIKALFFPTSGGRPIERYIKPEGEEIRVPPGSYHVIVYTWRTNAAAQSVQFRGTSYDTFEAYTEEMHQRLPIKSSNSSIPVVPQPDVVYAWNSGDDPIEISHTKGIMSRGTAEENLKVGLKTVVKEYAFEINVGNAEELNSIYAVLTYVQNSVPLGNGKAKVEQYGLLAQNVIRASELGEVTTYRCKTTAFGFHDTEKTFILNLTNKSGGGQQEKIDITQYVNDRDNGLIAPEEPIEVTSKEEPIVVDKSEISGGDGFVPPTLGDWEEKDENIEF